MTDAVLAACGLKHDPARIIHAIARERLHFLQGLRDLASVRPRVGDAGSRRSRRWTFKLAARTAAPVPIEPAFGKGQVAPPPPSPSRDQQGEECPALAASGTLAHTGAGTSLLLTIAIVALAIAAIGIIAWLRARWHARQQEAPTAQLLSLTRRVIPRESGRPSAPLASGCGTLEQLRERGHYLTTRCHRPRKRATLREQASAAPRSNMANTGITGLPAFGVPITRSAMGLPQRAMTPQG